MFSTNYRILLIFIALFIGLFSNDAIAQTSKVKIGIVNVKSALEQWTSYKQVQDSLKESYTRKQNELVQKRDSLAKEIESFSLQKELMPEESAAKKYKELQDEEMNLRALIQKNGEDFKNEQTRKIDPLVKKMKDVVEEIAKKEKFLLILPKDVILYNDQTLDITPKVISALNKSN
jgi:outer membrane protein